MKIAALYARVSTGNQEKQETINSQIAEIKERIAKDNLILGENLSFCDDGWSGSILARPELDRLRDAAKEKLFQVLYVYDSGRLSRNNNDLFVVAEEIYKYGIEIISLKDVVCSNNDQDDGKWLHSRVVGMFQEFERRKISERFRRGKLYKAKNKILFGWNPPYGYRYIKGDKKTIPGSFEVVKEEAEIVKKIFRWLIHEQMTIRQIILRLFEQKILPRKNKKGYWSTSTLSRLFRDKTYTGTTYYNKRVAVEALNPRNKDGYRRVKKTSRKNRPFEEWYPISVPSIINIETFNKAQQQLKANSQFCMKNRVHEYLLSTLVKCTCGNTRAGEGIRDHLYYRCTDRVNRFPLPKECFKSGVNATILDTKVWKEIYNLITNPKLIEKQYDRWNVKIKMVQENHNFIDTDKLKKNWMNKMNKRRDLLKPTEQKLLALNNYNPSFQK